MIEQKILPAVKKIKDFEKLLESDSDYIVLLDTRVSQLKHLVRYGQKAGKSVFVHTDLIQGLKTDDYGMEFLGQDIKPDGVISTRASVIQQSKRYRMTAIQRMFLIDSHAIDHNLKLIQKTKPDYVELLPGILPEQIAFIKETLGIPIIAGGLIRNHQEVNQAIEAGATAISTSRSDLWNF
ncbi:glycerol uptake operon antiterminator regulatory protein [Thalassobacillus devorans]|uniref:Glycerol uptake operon antiterminator regulatory protein n=1 Tax=Thalassobacillus devorans TaxID=279813 RepID=A0ABQ1NQ13_9BACI|nr:glycerol-3-phosphate responsive antiterminator [Thalassobacillus devorans]NIK28917.1 glycerol uptake operon antiterminator [Thalassobacillus devorans]GGC82598.1 glycerol uptake operon antiterminator regulatory protein [Thalassobacillus devorans]